MPTESDEDLVYDVKKKTGIVEYMKHLMRDAQQMKAKSDANLVLDNNTAPWLKDYAQKVLPEKHCEGQKDYFGKKGMSVHIDVLLTKNMLLNELVKHVYYTVLYRCKQTLEDTLSITENVLDEFKKDQPEVTKMFMKSDNAGCYHDNFSAEINHFICEKQGIKLQRYDLNEPKRGKDKCDREAAAAKNLKNLYVDAGKDVQDADVYNAFCWRSEKPKSVCSRD